MSFRELYQKNSIGIHMVFIIGVIGVVIATLGVLESPRLVVAFLDVGQGDAVWVQAPNGKEILIDAGPSQAVVQELADVKKMFDRTLDVVLITHPDADHVGGIPYVLDRFVIKTAMHSEVSAPTLVYKTVSEKINEHVDTMVTLRAGQRIILDQKHGVVVDVLFPDQNTTGWDTNEASAVVKISYGETSFLLTGDAPLDVEDFLATIYQNQITSNVLKLGHHGSNTSSSQNFLETVRPEFAVVSAGLGNRYGHPTAEVLEKAELVGAQILETGRMGTIVCLSDGQTVSCNPQ